MYQHFYAQNPLRALPLFALWLFLAVFLGTCAYLFLARRKQDFDGLAALPLDDSTVVARKESAR